MCFGIAADFFFQTGTGVRRLDNFLMHGYHHIDII